MLKLKALLQKVEKLIMTRIPVNSPSGFIPVNPAVTASSQESSSPHACGDTVNRLEEVAFSVLQPNSLTSRSDFSSCLDQWIREEPQENSVREALKTLLLKSYDDQGTKVVVEKVSSLPNVVSGMYWMKELECWNAPLTSLPQDIGRMTSLERLKLNGCQLQSLPDSFARLPSLESLTLSIRPPFAEQQVKQMQFPTTLKYLRISSMQPGTGLTEFPEGILQLSSLEELNLSSNAMTRVPMGFATLLALKKVDFSYNAFNRVPRVLVDLPYSVRVDVSSNPILDEEMPRLEFMRRRDIVQNVLLRRSRTAPVEGGQYFPIHANHCTKRRPGSGDSFRY